MSILFGISSEAAVSINKKSTTVFIGFAEQLSISGSSNKAVWSSSNKKIVEVMPNGVIYGIKPGKATVTAKVGKKKLKCRVTVRNYSRKMNISKSFVDPEVALDLRVDISDYPRSKK